MIKIVFYWFLVLNSILTPLFIQQANSQVPVNLRSTVGSSGSSQNLSLGKKDLIIQQSIGQASVIGLYHANEYSILQGFIQPLVSINQNSKVPTLELKAMIYPNPFTSDVYIVFQEKISGSLDVTLYDLFGKAIYRNKFSASQELSLNFSKISSGLYFIKINSDKKHFVTKMIKE